MRRLCIFDRLCRISKRFLAFRRFSSVECPRNAPKTFSNFLSTHCDTARLFSRIPKKARRSCAASLSRSYKMKTTGLESIPFLSGNRISNFPVLCNGKFGAFCRRAKFLPAPAKWHKKRRQALRLAALKSGINLSAG